MAHNCCCVKQGFEVRGLQAKEIKEQKQIYNANDTCKKHGRHASMPNCVHAIQNGNLAPRRGRYIHLMSDHLPTYSTEWHCPVIRSQMNQWI